MTIERLRFDQVPVMGPLSHVRYNFGRAKR